MPNEPMSTADGGHWYYEPGRSHLCTHYCLFGCGAMIDNWTSKAPGGIDAWGKCPANSLAGAALDGEITITLDHEWDGSGTKPFCHLCVVTSRGIFRRKFFSLEDLLMYFEGMFLASMLYGAEPSFPELS